MQSTLLAVSQIAFTSFGITFLVTQLSGPFGIIEQARDLFVKIMQDSDWAKYGVECMFCAGFWITLIASLAYLRPDLWLFALGMTYLLFIPVGVFKTFVRYVDDHSDHVDVMTGRKMANVQIIDAS